MNEILQPAVAQLLLDSDLSAETTSACIGAIMDGNCDGVDIAAFLTAISAKGPVVAEVAGAAQAMRDRCSRIVTSRSPLLDTCGTGGDRLHTFNISTATAIVAAACGVNVAKHGNRSVSSSSGSADVLEALGVNVALSTADSGKCLDEIGIAFCFAPIAHGAMKFAAPVRKQLGFPTIFNLLGPLTNPAGAEFQLLGANTIERAELLAQALGKLGVRRAFVVCGNGELDEVCLWGPTTVFVVEEGDVSHVRWEVEQFRQATCTVQDLKVSSAAESAEMILECLRNSDLPARSIVIANTAAALLVCGIVADLADGVSRAEEALASGQALRILEELKEFSNNVGA